MAKLYAQLRKTDGLGFFFETAKDYNQQITKIQEVLGLGAEAEDFDIQFIDGDEIDREVFEVLKVHQGTISAYLEAMTDWDLEEKIKVLITVSELGCSFKLGEDTPNQQDIDLYEVDSFRDLAIQFVEDGLFGEISASVAPYLDYEAIARDLRFDYDEFAIEGHFYIYRSY